MPNPHFSLAPLKPRRILPITLVALLLAAAVLSGCRGEAKKEQPAETPVSETAKLDEAPPAEEPPALRVLKLGSFPEALAFAKPQMTDTYNETSPGAVVLASWAMNNLKLSDVLVQKDETSYALVQKDAEEERGKKLCYGGAIVQIEVLRTDRGKLYDGILMNRRGELFKFLVAGSTGTLVQNSWGRVCGVAIGKFDYPNSGGGTGHAVQVVGMFDLPENRQSDPLLATAVP